MSNKKILKKQQLYLDYFRGLAIAWHNSSVALKKSGLNCEYQTGLTHHYVRCADRMARRIEKTKNTEVINGRQSIDVGQNPTIIDKTQ